MAQDNSARQSFDWVQALTVRIRQSTASRIVPGRQTSMGNSNDSTEVKGVTWRQAFPTGDLTNVSKARKCVRSVAAKWGVDENAVDSVELLASELLTNACRHVGGVALLGLHLSPDGGRLVIDCTDESQNSMMPGVGVGDAVAERGRGTLLMELLSVNTGEERTPGGKRIWCEMELQPAAPAPVVHTYRLRAEGIANGVRSALRRTRLAAPVPA